MPAFHIQFHTAPLTPAPTLFRDGEGAEARFLGVVRGEEEGKTIAGIEYSAYLPMAERTLHDLCERGQHEHGPHRVEIQHRLGFVAATEPSILIRVQTRHSAEAFDLCRWYLREIKRSVPIWKKPVWA